MRIIAGAWRGRPLVAPAGGETRPTADRVRETLFSMLASRIGSFEGLSVADLFAGSGALGLEALSRGAARAVFVDSGRAAADAIRANVAKLGAGDAARVLTQPVEALGAAPFACDLLFLDPPYRSGAALPALARLAAGGWIAPGAWISVETGAKEAPEPPGLTLDVRRKAGRAMLHLFRAG